MLDASCALKMQRARTLRRTLSGLWCWFYGNRSMRRGDRVLAGGSVLLSGLASRGSRGASPNHVRFSQIVQLIQAVQLAEHCPDGNVSEESSFIECVKKMQLR